MALTNGPLLNSVPAPIQQALQTNYLDLSSAANAGWGQQYLPDLMEKEAEGFEKEQSLVSFLKSVLKRQ